MTWVKLDDGWMDHPKFLGVSEIGQLLWVKGLTHACRHRTLGFIDMRAIPRLTKSKKPADLIRELVDAGLWNPCEGGYVIHDFEQYQPVPGKLSAMRSEAGKKGALTRWARPPDDGNCHPDANGKNDGNPISSDSSRASASGRDRDLSDPDPEGSAEGNQSETGYDLAWRLWQLAWSGKYKRPYRLTPDMSLRSEHRVLQRVGEQAKEQADPGGWLAHKFTAYLRDKGDRNYLADHEHPLRCLERDWNAYGEPRAAKPAPKAIEPEEKPEPLSAAEIARRAAELAGRKTA